MSLAYRLKSFDFADSVGMGRYVVRAFGALQQLV